MDDQILLPPGPIPTLKFCDHVVNVIEAEPLRLDMDQFRFTADDLKYREVPPPVCGMVACIGGWIAMLVNGDPKRDAELVALDALLGPYDDETYARLRRARHDLTACFYEFPEDGEERGTVEYAQAALTPFKAWIKEYRDVLAERTVMVNADT